MKMLILVVLASWATSSRLSGAAASFINFETAPVHPVDLSPDQRTLAVCNLPDGRVVLFDLTSGIPAQSAEIPVGVDPVSARFRTSHEVWVVNHISDSVNIVDVQRRQVVATLDTLSGAADVVFAGSPQRAFVTCAKANTIQVFDPATRELMANLSVDGDRPKALAASPDGSRVYAAIFESGNASTLLLRGPANPENPHGGQWPPPNRGTNLFPAFILDPNVPPEKYEADTPGSLIVKKNAAGRWMDDNGGDWTAQLAQQRADGWDMPDRDLAIIDTATLDVTYATGLMNICMAVGVNPVSGAVSVVGTDANNEVRFEPNLRGTFLRVNIATVDPISGAKQIRDLNPHLDYSVATVAQSVRDQSIGDPRGILWNAAGTKGYVTGMGSRNLVVIDALGQRTGSPIELSEGPSGLALDETRGVIYVLNRFGNSLSVVDTGTLQVRSNLSLFDPTSAAIKLGRKHLYDTRGNSGLGHVSCASCHVDARFDRLAWDLGNPALNATESPEKTIGGQSEFFHPMKGPLVTQTFQDIIGSEPLHWRGDRENIEAFNITFRDLLARDTMLTGTEMQEFRTMLSTIYFPPNRFRNFDNSFPTDIPIPPVRDEEGDLRTTGNALRGRDIFIAECRGCHQPGTGRGGGDDVFIRRDSKPLKVAQLRSLPDKIGFDPFEATSRAGFGFRFDGRRGSLASFLREINLTSSGQDANLIAFLLTFSGSDILGPESSAEAGQNAAAAVGRQLTITSPAGGALLTAMVALAQSPTSRVDLVAHAYEAGLQRGWYYYRATRLFQNSRDGENETLDQLLTRANTDHPLTFTMVHRGTGHRIGVDRDGDGYSDGLEMLFDYDPLDPRSRGGNTAPRIGAVLEQTGALDIYLHPGMSVIASFAAVDPDVPGQTLLYSLGPGAPTGMTLNPATGALQWTPSPLQFESTHGFVVNVRDNGAPPLSDTRSVDVTVRALRILDIAVPHEATIRPFETVISWYSVPGQRYQLERTDELHAPTWEPMLGLEANLPISSVTESTFFPSPQRFYRIKWIQ